MTSEGCLPDPGPRRVVIRVLRLLLLEHGQHVASRVLEPGDVRPLAAGDALLVLLEAVVPLEANATGGQLVDGLVDVVDLEVEDRVGAGVKSGLR